MVLQELSARLVPEFSLLGNDFKERILGIPCIPNLLDFFSTRWIG